MNLSTFNFKKLPVAFIASVIIFFALEAIVLSSPAFWRFCYSYTDPKSHDDPLRLEAVLKTIDPLSENKKILLVGCSQTREGYDTQYLNERFKHAQTIFYNLGAVGNAQPLDILMLRDKILEKKPDVVIYTAFVGSLYTDYASLKFNRMKYHFKPSILPHMLKYIKVSELKPHADDIVESFLGDISEIYKYRRQFSRVFARALKHHLNMAERPDPFEFIFKENQPKSYFERHIINSQEDRYNYTQYTKINEEAFSLVAQAMVDQGIEFIVVSGPTHPLIGKTYDTNLDDQFDNFFNEQARKHGFTYLSKNDLPEFHPENFVDFTHLNSLGRSKFSEFIGKYLAHLKFAKKK